MPSKYWNGTGNWTSTSPSYWYLDDAHLSGTTIPTSTDDVYFTSNSTGTCTVSFGSISKSIDMTGFAGTLAGNSNLNVYGGLILSGGTFSYNGNIIFNATGGTWSIYTNRRSLGQIDFSGDNFGHGGIWNVMDNLTSTGWMALSNGTVNFNGNIISISGGFRTNTSAARGLNISGATFYLGSSSYSWAIQNTTNLSFTGGTEYICFTGSSTTGFYGGGFNYEKVHFIGTASNIIFNDDCSFNELKITPKTAGQTFLNYTPGTNGITVNNNLVISGSSYVNRIWFKTNTYTYSGIEKITNNGTLTMSDVDFHCITASGSTPWSGTRIGDGGVNSGIIFDTPRTLYWVAISGGSWSSYGSWSLSSGGASGEAPPLPQDDVIFDRNSITSISRTITANCHVLGKNLDFNDIKNNPTVAGDSTINPRSYGSILIGTGATYTSNQYIYLLSESGVTVTTRDKVFPWNFTIYLLNNSIFEIDGFFSATQLQLAVGNIDSNNNDINLYTIGAASDISSHGGGNINLGSSNITVTGFNTTIIDFTSNLLSLSAGTSFFKITSGNGTNNNTILALGGKTFYNFRFMKTIPSPYYYTITGSNKFNDLNLNNTSGNTIYIRFTDGTTQTVTGFTASGTSPSRIVKLTGTGTGTWTMTKTGTGTTCCDYLDLSGSTVTPSNTWYAGANSINRWNNTGWLFTSCTQIKAFLQVLYSTSISKVNGVAKSAISKISGLG
jgi:hypothetical protein